MTFLKRRQSSPEHRQKAYPDGSPVPTVASIGVMAHNEAGRIERTLRSLLGQELLRTPTIEQGVSSHTCGGQACEIQVELHVLANGCADNTADIAQATLADVTRSSLFETLRWSVDVIEQPGKSNAWNLFVHQLSNPKADYLVLMDADIEILGPHTLESMVDALLQHPSACIAVDRPIKDAALKVNRTWSDRLSVALSSLSGKTLQGGQESSLQDVREENKIASPAWLCGQLYCGRAAALRQIHLPISSLAEDGLLYQWIASDGLAAPIDPHRVILAKSAAHSFEAYTHLGLLLKHERWLIASSSTHELLYAHLRDRHLTGLAASQYIHQRNQEDPRWLHKLVNQAARQRRWLVPSFVLTKRFESLSGKSAVQILLMLPLAIAAFLVDLGLAYLANRDLHRGVALKYWGKPASEPTSRSQLAREKQPL